MSAQRECGACDLCCTLLRVDALPKLAGVPCRQLRPGGGCGIYERRPQVCRGYRCLWLRGRLEDGDRPDRLGAVLDLRDDAGAPRLEIREARPGAFEHSERLHEIAARFRGTIPVRISATDDVMNPDAPFRLLLPDGSEQRVVGDRIETRRDGRLEIARMPWARRLLRSGLQRWRARRLRRLHARGSEY